MKCSTDVKLLVRYIDSIPPYIVFIYIDYFAKMLLSSDMDMLLLFVFVLRDATVVCIIFCHDMIPKSVFFST